MTADRQIEAVAKAIREAEACATFSHPHYEELAKAAIEASDAKYVPMLVEALGDIVGVCQSDLETHFGSKIGSKIRKALAQLPEDLRP